MNKDFDSVFGLLVFWTIYFFFAYGMPRKIIRALQTCGQEEHETRVDLLTEAMPTTQMVVDQPELLFPEDRMIGDFVLTRAAVPMQPIVIHPTEGFRLSKNKEFGNGKYEIIVAVSAEKMPGLLQDAVALLGRFIDMEVIDMGAEPGQVVSYLTYSIEPPSLTLLLRQHGAFIINCGEIALSLRGDNGAQLFLAWNKHIYDVRFDFFDA